jgi:hypothetical protein
VRAVFQTLRSDDTRELVSYEHVLARPLRGRDRRTSSPVLRFAAAVAIIAGASVAYRAVTSARHSLSLPPDVVALVAWKPATDVFLPASAGLTSPSPTLGGSIVDFTPLTTRSRP